MLEKIEKPSLTELTFVRSMKSPLISLPSE